jgi:alcohol dehydrogenase
VENFEYYNPDRIIFGGGERHRIGEELKNRGCKNVLFTVGKGPFRKNGMYDEISGIIKKAGVKIHSIADIDSNPRIGSVREGAKACKKHAVDCVIALGGGSTIDCCKIIAASATVDDDPWEYLWGHRKTFDTSLATLMIPTIAATGSDINPYAVILDEETSNKTFAFSEALYPTLTLADPELMVSVPPNVTIWGAMDIMSHTFEFYFNGNRTSIFQTRFSESLIHSNMECLTRLVKNPNDTEARGELWWISVMAWGGLTMIGRGNPDMGVHIISEGIVPQFDLHHGATIGLVTPRWMRYAAQKAPSYFARFAETIFGVTTGNESEKAGKGVELYIDWLKKVGGSYTLQDLTGKSLSEDEIRALAAKVVESADWEIGVMVKLREEDIFQILSSCCKPL